MLFFPVFVSYEKKKSQVNKAMREIYFPSREVNLLPFHKRDSTENLPNFCYLCIKKQELIFLIKALRHWKITQYLLKHLI